MLRAVAFAALIAWGLGASARAQDDAQAVLSALDWQVTEAIRTSLHSRYVSAHPELPFVDGRICEFGRAQQKFMRGVSWECRTVDPQPNQPEAWISVERSELTSVPSEGTGAPGAAPTRDADALTVWNWVAEVRQDRKRLLLWSGCAERRGDEPHVAPCPTSGPGL